MRGVAGGPFSERDSFTFRVLFQASLQDDKREGGVGAMPMLFCNFFALKSPKKYTNLLHLSSISVIIK